MKRVLWLLAALAAALSAGFVLVSADPPGPAEAPVQMVQRVKPLAEKPSSPAEEPPLPDPESSSAEEPSSASEPAPPVPKDRDLPPVEEGAWTLRLVNWANPLPMDFAPEYEAVQGNFVLDKRIAGVARKMIADAQGEGVTLVVNSAYRPYSAQQLVYDDRYRKYLEEGKSEEEARYLTDSYVAVPGCSEHQLGLAMDIVAAGKDEFSRGWLGANAPDYGFILRYPEDKTSITHTAYESWHYRYVGVAAAREITARGLCLEEYLAERG